jgi:hypothetical protein
MTRLPPSLVVAAVGALALASSPATAQTGAQLIRQGIADYNDFEPARALPLLRRGVDPRSGPQDSLWALGTQYLAQIVYEQGDTVSARVWARWAMRLAPGMPLDTLNLISQVIGLFRNARTATAASPDDRLATTEWLWPAADPGAGPGRIEVRAGPVPVTVVVVGRGVVSPRMTLPAGTYEIQASAPGHRQARITREVLPGIGTVLGFALEPERAVAVEVLSDDVRARAGRSVAGISVTRFGVPQPACAAGVLVGRDGLLLTTYQAIRGADRVSVMLGDRTPISEAAVAAHDVSRDLAVLALALPGADSLTVGGVDEGGFAWGFGSGAGCRAARDERVTLTWADRPAGLVGLRDSLPSAVPGTPLIGADGSLLGIATARGRVIAAGTAADVLQQARQAVAARRARPLAEVARSESHAYGSLALSAPSLPGAAAQITPQESWQWPELARAGTLPLTLVGPQGRYRVVITAQGQTRLDSTLVVIPGRAGQYALPAPQQIAARRKGRFPWVIAVVGAVGAGAGVALLAGGGGGGDGGNGATTGSIFIRFRDP